MGPSFDPNWKNEDHCDSSLLVYVHSMVGISSEATVRELKNCRITSAVDGSDMLLNDSEKAGSVSRECEEGEGTSCKGGHSADNVGGEVDTSW